MKFITVLRKLNPGILRMFPIFYQFQIPDCRPKLFLIYGNTWCQMIGISLPEHPKPEKTVLNPLNLPGCVRLVIGYAQIRRIKLFRLSLPPQKRKLIRLRLAHQQFVYLIYR